MRTPAMLPPPPPPNPTWEATQQSFAHFRDLVDHLPKSVYEVVQLKQELDSITRANWFLLCREWARPTRGRPAQSQAEALIRVLKLAVKQYFPYRIKAIEAVLQPIHERLSSPTYCYHSRLLNLLPSESPDVRALQQVLMNLPLKGFETLSRAKLFGEDVKALEKLLGKEKRARKTAESIILQVFRNLAPEAELLVEDMLDSCVSQHREAIVLLFRLVVSTAVPDGLLAQD
ncbi:hypothetical protein JCM16303_004103 [Sporobolomyces ruberrimus]